MCGKEGGRQEGGGKERGGRGKWKEGGGRRGRRKKEDRKKDEGREEEEREGGGKVGKRTEQRCHFNFISTTILVTSEDKPTYLYSFNGIFHLEQAPFRRKGVHSPVSTRMVRVQTKVIVRPIAWPEYLSWTC